MAKKTTGRLAGLAALAAAAYMINKGKGEGEGKGEDKGKGPDRDTDTGVDAMPKAEPKANDITVSGEGGFDAPANMNSISRVGTPARTVSSPSAPATKIPQIKNIGGGRSGGRGGPEAGEEAAYRAKLTPAIKIGTGSGRGGRGGPEAGEEAAYRASRDTGDAMSRRIKTENDGGKSVIDRQNASGTAAKPTTAEIDETKLSLSDRIKMSRERARSGSGQTDTRSVNERMREAIGMKKGGMTASRRGDGIAQRGKTRGKMY